MPTAPRSCLVVPVLVLLGLPACSSDDGPGVGDGVLPLRQDVALGFDERSGGSLEAAFVDSTGSPVAIATLDTGTPAGTSQPYVFRGSDPQPVLIEEFGSSGSVEAAALAPDDTLVVVGRTSEAGLSIVRIARDDSAQVLPVTGAGAGGPDPDLGAVALSADGSTAVLARAVADYGEGYELRTGEVEVWRVDTATGAVTASIRSRMTDPRAHVPGSYRAVEISDVAATPDGGAAVAVEVAAESGSSAQLLRIDAGFGTATAVQLQERRGSGFDRFLAVDASGTVYATTVEEADGDTLRVLALSPGSAEPTVAVEVPDEPGTSGLAVAADGSRAYLTDLIGGAGAALSSEISVFDVADGRRVGETVLCEQGDLGEAVVAGEHLVVTGECGVEGEMHLYVLGSA